MPRKRKATVTSSSTAAEKVKKVRIGDSSVIDEEHDHDTTLTTTSGRPKRSSIGEPTYVFTRRRLTRAPKAEDDGNEDDGADTTQAPTPTVPVKRGRGRPPKLSTKAEPETQPKKRVGRPPKKVTEIADQSSTNNSTKTQQSKNVANAKPAKQPASARLAIRGQPKSNAIDLYATNAEGIQKAKVSAPGRRGRPKKTVTSLSDTVDQNGTVLNEYSSNVEISEEDLGAEDAEDDRQYWLMKAEPESRIEKGHDVKFSIDDLMNSAWPEPWDGVRNPVARNNMRAMRKGDLAFFYHSNCAVPGIAGVMKIVQEHSIDESAFNPKHPYYDPKSVREKPKWELVHVQFVHKFKDLVKLKLLRGFAEKGGELESMQMLKQSRLSVSSVSPKEWAFIVDLTGEDEFLNDLQKGAQDKAEDKGDDDKEGVEADGDEQQEEEKDEVKDEDEKE